MSHLTDFRRPRESREICKPQLKFEPEIDNSDSPFKPSLREKPNAIIPLNIYLERDKYGDECYCHPYMAELNSFKVPQNQLQKAEPILPANINDAAFYVNKKNSLTKMIADLKNATELAVDSEYHSIRSYHGFTCLLQISTRTKDYIIDTIALRNELEPLNEFFTNPKILKVLHNAANDVIWLQKDLNLYLVNMFDTSLAGSQLGLPRPGLGHLLKQYCEVDIEKNRKFQSYFDWRIRPLTEKAKLYARNDTHYLLYLYDILRNELIDKVEGGLTELLHVYDRSSTLCKERFKKTSNTNAHLALLRKRKTKEKPLDNRQIHALKSLYQWRDIIAREMDESTGYVLPNSALLQIVELLPDNDQGMLDCFKPNPVSTFVRENLPHLHNLISEARDLPISQDLKPQASQSKKRNTGRRVRTKREPRDRKPTTWCFGL